MAFESDAAKNTANFAKHGIDFQDAVRIFEGPVLEKIDRRRDYGEERIAAVGVAIWDLSCTWSIPFAVISAASSRHGGPTRMKRKRIVAGLRGSSEPRRTDWRRVAAMSEKEIMEAAKSDPDAQPTDLDLEFWKNAKVVLPEPKQPITLRIDRDVLVWFKAQGGRYQSRMNAVLKAYVQAHRKAG
jgi:uncharacterized protein (DUF4415 family)/uncharacterized DUF497 family protein